MAKTVTANQGLSKWRNDVAELLKRINKRITAMDDKAETDPIATIVPEQARNIVDELLELNAQYATENE